MYNTSNVVICSIRILRIYVPYIPLQDVYMYTKYIINRLTSHAATKPSVHERNQRVRMYYTTTV